MSSLTYIKGVRTRFRNSLDEEIKNCNDILQHDQNDIDIEEEIKTAKKCLKLLQSYREKRESQSEKYVGALSESEVKEADTIINDDYILCDKALDCSYDLDTYLDKLTSDTKASVVTEQVTEMQENMQSFMESQSKRQQEYVELQSKRQLDFLEKQMTEQHDILDGITASEEPSVPVKLPKLELRSFNGDKMKWFEFWDTFECAVHKNGKLSQIEKFSYLQTKLVGEANAAISGLSLCNENYGIAVSLLQERFGKKQDIIDMHYRKMMNIAPPCSKTESLRIFLDTTEKHLRSQEVLGENLNQNLFVSIIKTNIPKYTLLQLELQKGTRTEWSVNELRERLRAYIIAREHAEESMKGETSGKTNHDNGFMGNFSLQRNISRHQRRFETRQMTAKRPISAETLESGEKQRYDYANKCRYCAHPHWSDECTHYKTIAERQRILKDSCFRCLKVGHKTGDCRLSKICVHCGEKDAHHRSLCSKKFTVKTLFRQDSANVAEEQQETDPVEILQENVLVSSGEVVLMQTATTEAKGPTCGRRIRLLLDSGSQRTYVTERLAEQLEQARGEDQNIKLVTFGSKKAKVIKTPSTTLKIKLNDGEYMTINANIVPDITGTIERKAVHLQRLGKIQHILNSVDLADTMPTINENSTVDILIGNEYYLDFVLPQRIVLQPGLHLLSSKLGWILTVRTNGIEDEAQGTSMLVLTYGSEIAESTSFTSVDIVVPRKPDLEDFWAIESIGILDDPKSSDDETAMVKFRDSLKFEEGRYQATWPWKEEIPDLPINRGLAYGRLKSTVSRMKDKPGF